MVGFVKIRLPSYSRPQSLDRQNAPLVRLFKGRLCKAGSNFTIRWKRRRQVSKANWTLRKF